MMPAPPGSRLNIATAQRPCVLLAPHKVSVPPVGSHELSPVPIRGTAANVTQLAGSKGSFVLSLRSDGTVWGWGDNQDHQLGDLTGQRTFAPVQIHGLPPGIV